jgi:RNA polymerase sigma-54 factor
MVELRLEQEPAPDPDQSQDQEHAQRLIVSEKHQQAIELLQYPVQELSQWVNQQLQENPLLELNREEPVEPPEVEDQETDSPLEEVNLDELVNRGEDYSLGYGGGGADSEDSEFQFRQMASQHQSLNDSLQWQLSLRNLPEEKHDLGERLISHINEDGHFEGDLEEIARDEDVSVQQVETVLETIQEFDPPGVGGRSLEEVLLIQLRRETDSLQDVVREVIEEHFEDLQNRSFNKIAQSTGLDKSDVQTIADRVHELEPRPGRVHEPANRQYITPDVKIREVNDDFAVIVNDEIPPLTISSRYRALLDSDDEETREYVEDKLKGALWIIHCIHQRHETLQKVTKSIARHQSDFFANGVKELKPLVLKDIADDVGVHESTVSRSVKDKYVQTPRGLYPLDFFFSSKLESDDDQPPVSSTAVKATIKEIIHNEDQTDPYSDREIKEKLNEDGVKINRRTISKYRKEMLIPPRKLRKRVDEPDDSSG